MSGHADGRSAEPYGARRRGLAVRAGEGRGQVEGDRRRRRVGVGDFLALGNVIGMRPALRVERERTVVRGHRELRGGRYVDPAATLGIHRHAGRRDRGAHQSSLQLRRLPVGMLLGQQRGGTGDVRGRHRRTTQAQVTGPDRVADLAVRRLRGDDVDARRGHVRLRRAVVDRRAAAGELREPIVAVDGADRERRRRAPRGADGARVRPSLPAATTNRVPYCVLRVSTACSSGSMPGSVVAAEAQVDHLRALLDGPVHAGQDPRVGAAVVHADLAGQEVGVRRDALVPAVRRGARTADDRGHVGRVTVRVLRAFRGEVRPTAAARRSRGGPRRRRCRVPRPSRRDRCSRRPRPRSADLRDAVVQQQLAPAVEPDLVDPAGCLASAGQGAEELGEFGRGDPGGPAVDRREFALGGGAGVAQRRRRGGRRTGVRDDQGEGSRPEPAASSSVTSNRRGSSRLLPSSVSASDGTTDNRPP